MTKKELIQKMRILKADKDIDTEDLHIRMDYLLLEFINDDKVSLLFNNTTKWYA
jgi:hypothetical protein